MPDPKEGETRRDFVERCVPIVIDDGTAETPAQAVAVCNSMYDEGKSKMPETKKKRKMTPNGRLLRRIWKRDVGDPFGYGITTADRYVRQAVKECGDAVLHQNFKFENAGSLIKTAKRKLVYCNPDMSSVKRATSISEMQAMLPAGMRLPPHSAMVNVHVLTTSREDRDKDVLRTSGAEVDPRLPSLWQHIHTLPVGKMLAVVEHTQDVLKIASVIIDLNELTADIVKLVEAEVLRMSHGFQALEFNERKAEESEFPGPPGFEVTRFSIMEESYVSVPSNIGAEIELFSRGKLESDLFKTHAKHYLDKRPVQVPGNKIVHQPKDEKELDDAIQSQQEKQFEQNIVPSIEIPKQAEEKHVVRVQEAPTAVTLTFERSEESRQEASAESDTKAGRVLSERNLKALEKVRADLKDLSDMNLSNAGQALCERCIRRLDEVIEAAHKPRNDDDRYREPTSLEDKPKAVEQKQTIEEMAAEIIATASDEQLEQLAKAIGSVLYSKQQQLRSAQYQELIEAV